MLQIDNSWTLFLDRDGVINERIPNDYVKDWEDFVFEEGVLETLAELKNKFYKIVVVTNQQCIAKGTLTEVELHLIHENMLKIVAGLGGKIDHVFFAPGLKSKENMLRKPNTGMAQQAKNMFPEIDYKKSIMVGDTDSDMIFGKKLGMKTVQVFSKYETYEIKPHYRIDKLNKLTNILSYD